jgi:hypothetical protein
MRNMIPLIAIILLIQSSTPASSLASSTQEPCVGIGGRVTTEDGALVHKATITAKNLSTKQSEMTVSSDVGEYKLCVPSGNYDVTAALAGFKTAERKSIRVEQPGSPGSPVVDFVLILIAYPR